VLAGVPQPFAFDHNHSDGYTVGAGLEYIVAQNWSAKGRDSTTTSAAPSS